MVYSPMSSDRTALKEKIQSSTEVTPALVDSLNDLALLEMDANPPMAIELLDRAITDAQKIKYGKGEALANIRKGLYASRQRNYDEAKSFYNRALAISEVIDDKVGIAEAHAKLGSVSIHASQFGEAIQHNDIAISIREEIGDIRGVADLKTNSGIVFGLQGNYYQSLKALLEALKIYEKINDHSRIVQVAVNIGTIYKEQRNYSEALKILNRGLDIARNANDTRLASDLLNNIGNIYFEQQQYDEALSVHQNTLALRNEIGDTSKIATSLSNIGDVYKALGKHELTLNFYSQSLSLFQTLNEKRKLVPSYYNIGELYFLTGDYDKANFYLHEALKLAEETGLKDHLRKAAEYLAKLYAHGHNFEDAYKYQLMFSVLDREISNTESNRQIAQLSMRHEIEQREREAELERVKNTELTKAYNSLEIEKKRSEELLNNILPEEVSEELKQSGKTRARSYEQVTVMFADIQGFTKISEQLSAEDIVSGIDEYFEAFDKIIDKYGIEKIKTIGDAYLCACGIPIQVENHAEKMVQAAIEFIDTTKVLQLKRESEKKPAFAFRVGIHTGPLVAGVVGIKKFAYDIWGDTVNTASRMQQSGLANQINISESTYSAVKNRFKCEYRGEIEAKNKGKLKMYFVVNN